MSTYGSLLTAVEGGVIPQLMVDKAEKQKEDKARGQRIGVAFRISGVSRKAVAQACGVTPQAVAKWISTGKISRDNLVVVADMTEHRLDWLNSGKGPQFLFAANVHRGPSLRGRYPLISWVQAGRWREIEGQLGVDDAKDWLPCTVSCGPHTFVLRVQGDSMDDGSRDAVHDGDLIFVDPDVAHKHRDLVVVRLPDTDEATFKQLVFEGSVIYLRALNPGYPLGYFKMPTEAVIVGVAIYTSRDLR